MGKFMHTPNMYITLSACSMYPAYIDQFPRFGKKELFVLLCFFPMCFLFVGALDRLRHLIMRLYVPSILPFPLF